MTSSIKIFFGTGIFLLGFSLVFAAVQISGQSQIEIFSGEYLSETYSIDPGAGNAVDTISWTGLEPGLFAIESQDKTEMSLLGSPKIVGNPSVLTLAATNSLGENQTLEIAMQERALPPMSCADVLAGDPGATDGLYTIHADDEVTSFEVYCDMTSPGGPYTHMVEHVAAGFGHTCALLADTTVKCWGYNRYGQLGDGTTTDRSTPVAVSGLNDVVSLSAGWMHTCALLSDGSVQCWGYNYYYNLGDGTLTNRTTPVAVQNVSNAVQISSDGHHSCTLLTGGTMKCWGRNSYGQIGNNTIGTRRHVTVVLGISTATSIGVGVYHSCAVLSDGTALCWGRNNIGQIGIGSTNNYIKTPRAVLNLTNIVAIDGGEYHTCALLDDGTAQCWGNGYNGQLGDGATTYRTSPVAVQNLNTIDTFSLGARHSCVVLDDDTAQCWGQNIYGQLGDGTTTNSSVPVSVQGISNAQSIVGGSYHTCSALSNKTAKCWGRDTYGQLGGGIITGFESLSSPSTLSQETTSVSVPDDFSFDPIEYCADILDKEKKLEKCMEKWEQEVDKYSGIGPKSLTPQRVEGL